MTIGTKFQDDYNNYKISKILQIYQSLSTVSIKQVSNYVVDPLIPTTLIKNFI